MATDEQIEAFGQAFWPVNARSKIDANREELRAALATLLASQEAEIAELRDLLDEGLGIVATAVSGFDALSDSDNAWSKSSVDWRYRVRAALRPAEKGEPT